MKFEPQSVAYGIRFKTILFPLTFLELANSLEKKGYELNPGLPFPRPLGRMTGAGEVARKGKAVVQIDSGAQILTIVDVSITSAQDCFNQIVQMLKEDYGVNIDDLARSYSFSASYKFHTKKPAYKSIAGALKIPIFDNLKTIMNEEIWPLELRFGGANQIVNSENWFDISIRPDYERNDSYVVQTVYRSSDKTKTQKFIESFEERMTEIITLIEG